MNEHRLNERLTSYWNNARKDAAMPEFAKFNAGAIEDIWKQCILFVIQPTVDGRTPNVNFYSVGDSIKSVYGSDMTGRSFNPAQKHFQGAAIMQRVNDIMSNPIVVHDSGQFINERSKVVKYRSCRLPFGRNGKVTHIVAGLSWREF